MSNPEPSTGEPPAFLEPEARAEWVRLAPVLIAHGWLSILDEPLLATYVSALAELRRVEGLLREQGNTYSDSKGDLRRRPESITASQLRTSIRGLGNELGLSPAGRSRLRSSPPEEEDPYEIYLKRGRG